MKNIDVLKKGVFLIIGSAVYAAGIGLFLDPNNLAPGGVSGISIMLNRFTHIPTGTLILWFNIPILIAGARKFGMKFAGLTLLTIAISSYLINLCAGIGALTSTPLLAALSGGACVSTGMAFILKAGATTGGIDIIVRLIRLKVRHIKTGMLFLITDMIVIIASGFVFGNIDSVLYAAVSSICSAFLMDMLLYGRDEAKLLYIISNHGRQIADRLLGEMNIGATFINGIGAYSNEERIIILCAMRKTRLAHAERIVKEIDTGAFMIVTKATEIFGEGYKGFDEERL